MYPENDMSHHIELLYKLLYDLSVKRIITVQYYYLTIDIRFTYKFIHFVNKLGSNLNLTKAVWLI